MKKHILLILGLALMMAAASAQPKKGHAHFGLTHDYTIQRGTNAAPIVPTFSIEFGYDRLLTDRLSLGGGLSESLSLFTFGKDGYGKVSTKEQMHDTFGLQARLGYSKDFRNSRYPVFRLTAGYAFRIPISKLTPASGDYIDPHIAQPLQISGTYVLADKLNVLHGKTGAFACVSVSKVFFLKTNAIELGLSVGVSDTINGGYTDNAVYANPHEAIITHLTNDPYNNEVIETEKTVRWFSEGRESLARRLKPFVGLRLSYQIF